MSQTLRDRILAVITAIRESHMDSVYLYTQGQCYAFYKILRSVFGDAVECWYDPIEGHAYSKIGEFWYDIRGEWSSLPKTAGPIEEVGNSDHPENWGRRDMRRLIDISRPTENEARDLTDYKAHGVIDGGLKRGEMWYISSEKHGATIWNTKDPVTVRDVLALAQRKGYIGVVDNEPLNRLLSYIGNNFRPKFVDTGLGYEQTNLRGDAKLIELAAAVGEIPDPSTPKKYLLEDISDEDLRTIVDSRSNGSYHFPKGELGVCHLNGELVLSALETICEFIRRSSPDSTPLLARTTLDHDGLEDEEGKRIGPFQLTYKEAMEYIDEEEWDKRLYGEISAGKGGRGWFDDSFQWKRDEVEALCTVIRYRAGSNAEGVLELLDVWKELKDD